MNAGSPIGAETQDHYAPKLTGVYSVEVTDTNGCTLVSDTLTVVIVGLENGLEAFGLELYPNPTRGSFKLRSAQPMDFNLQITISDMYGHKVKAFHVPQMITETSFDIQGLAMGTYLVEALTESGQRSVFRLVVQ